VSDERDDTRLVELNQYGEISTWGRICTVTVGIFRSGLPHLGYMKAFQTPHRTQTTPVVIRNKVASFASRKKISGKRMIFNKQRDADVKTNLNGIGTYIISKPKTEGHKRSDMIAAVFQIKYKNNEPRKRERVSG
jgi:hypothetical protein